MKKNMVLPALGMAMGVVLGEKCQVKRAYEIEEDNAKFHEFYDILLQWIKVHQSGRTLADYFCRYGYKTVAVYGLKELGEALIEELKDTEIEVKYGIDKTVDKTYRQIDIYKPDDDLPEVDIIVVTAVHYYADIEMALRNKLKYPIVALNDVVYEA
ncbi:MAG: hypothetical protein NC430_07270 [bacterium]|nr:hypothetical protein [bacterium]MCM1423620.1 hypothetical protein [bacterium]